MSDQTQRKRGPRGGRHSNEARQKMRDAWAERKRLVAIGLRADAEQRADAVPELELTAA